MLHTNTYPHTHINAPSQAIYFSMPPHRHHTWVGCVTCLLVVCSLVLLCHSSSRSIYLSINSNDVHESTSPSNLSIQQLLYHLFIHCVVPSVLAAAVLVVLADDDTFEVEARTHSRYGAWPPITGTAITSGTEYGWLALTCAVRSSSSRRCVLIMSSISESRCTLPSQKYTLSMPGMMLTHAARWLATRLEASDCATS